MNGSFDTYSYVHCCNDIFCIKCFQYTTHEKLYILFITFNLFRVANDADLVDSSGDNQGSMVAVYAL